MSDTTLDYPAQTTRSDRLGAILLALCMFTTGGAGLVIEYVVATTTTFILGSSIIVFSLVIGVMLGAMGFSGWIQKRIGDSYLLEKFFAIEVTLALAGGFAPIGLFWAYGAMPEHFNLVLYSWTILIGLLIGLEIPVVMRILELKGIGLKINLQYVFGADYIGAMVFMFVWVYWLLPNFPITEISFMVSGLNFFVALIAVCYFGYFGNFKNFWMIAVVALMAASATAYGYTHNRTWNVHLEQRLFDDPIVYQTTTRYQHLVVTKATGTRCGTEIRLYINGNTQFGSCDEHVYHDNLVFPAMTLAERAEDILILGGGDGLGLRDVLRHNPRSVMLVDLDPAMVAIATENKYLRALNQNAFSDARVVAQGSAAVSQDGGLFTEVPMPTGRIDSTTNVEETISVADVRRMHIDAGKFLEIADETYDVIIVDLPDPSSVELSKLYTTLFYKQLRKRLRPGGVVAIQSTSPTHAREVFLEIGRTLDASGINAIPFHDNVPSFGDWGFWLGCHGYKCREALLERIKTLDAFEVRPTYLTPDRFRANLTFGQVKGIPFLASAKSDRVNTMTDPTMFMRYEHAWKSY